MVVVIIHEPYPKGDEAWHELEWLKAKQKNTSKSYDEYIANHGSSKRFVEASQAYDVAYKKEAIEAYEIATKENSIEFFQNFLNDFRYSKQAEKAKVILEKLKSKKEEEAFNKAKKSNSISKLKKFLDDNFFSPYKNEARALISKLVKERAEPDFILAKKKNTIEGYTEFIENFKGTPEATKAKIILSRLESESQKKKELQGYMDMLEQGPEQRDAALVFASGHGHLKIVKIILGKGVSPNANTRDGASALEMAIQQGHYEVVTVLIKTGAKVNRYSVKGLPYLCLSIQLRTISNAGKENALKTTKLLLENGADINSKTRRGGMTPLMLASYNSLKEHIKLLLEKGANVEIKDKYGKTALDHAIDPETAKLLK